MISPCVLKLSKYITLPDEMKEDLDGMTQEARRLFATFGDMMKIQEAVGANYPPSLNFTLKRDIEDIKLRIEALQGMQNRLVQTLASLQKQNACPIPDFVGGV